MFMAKYYQVLDKEILKTNKLKTLYNNITAQLNKIALQYLQDIKNKATLIIRNQA